VPFTPETAFGAGVFVFREEPEADGNLRAVEELAGEGDHAVHEAGLEAKVWRWGKGFSGS